MLSGSSQSTGSTVVCRVITHTRTHRLMRLRRRRPSSSSLAAYNLRNKDVHRQISKAAAAHRSPRSANSLATSARRFLFSPFLHTHISLALNVHAESQRRRRRRRKNSGENIYNPKREKKKKTYLRDRATRHDTNERFESVAEQTRSVGKRSKYGRRSLYRTMTQTRHRHS